MTDQPIHAEPMHESPANDARDPVIRATAMPTDANPYGGVFGGWLMGQMALGAGALASRIGQGKAVVVSATDFAFPGVMAVGDELSVYADVVEQGNTSLTISVEAIGRERHGEAQTQVARGTFKFVLLDDEGKPRPVALEAAAALPVRSNGQSDG